MGLPSLASSIHWEARGSPVRVLIVDDDSKLVQELAKALRREGHKVSSRATLLGLPDVILTEGVHLIIFEPGLATLDQVGDLCRSIHHESPAILFAVTRLTSAHERVSLLEAGVDDYLAKPLDRRELLARLRTLLGRHPLSLPGRGSSLVQITDEWMLDLAGQRLVGKGREVALSAREFQLLAYMVRHEGVALSREALVVGLWGPDYEGSAREVDVYVCYLRRKLEPEPKRPRHILAVWGVGYRYTRSTAGQESARD